MTRKNEDLIDQAEKRAAQEGMLRMSDGGHLLRQLAEALRVVELEQTERAAIWREAYKVGRSRKMVDNPYLDMNLYGQSASISAIPVVPE